MRKRFWIVGFCLFVLLAAAALSIMVGSFAISPSDVLRTLLGGEAAPMHLQSFRYGFRVSYLRFLLEVRSVYPAPYCRGLRKIRLQSPV